MTKYRQALCLPVLVFACANIYAQNLVQNPSFEQYTDCPTTGGVDGIDLAYPWYSVQNGSIDYYNTCSSVFQIPWRGQGDYQETFNGNGYAGMWCYSAFIANAREYLQAPMTSALLPGRNYRMEFYINACNISQSAVNSIGLHFSNTPIAPSGSENLLTVPSYIYKFGNPIIKDTVNWTKIDGVYLALGGESYITIGNFMDDANTQVEEMPNGTSSFPTGYYFVEDVLIEEINLPFWEYRDTSVYYGDSVLIGPALTGLDIDWYTSNMEFISNSPGIYVKPATSRNYIAKETFNGSETTHNVHVTVIGGAGIEEIEPEQIKIYPNPAKNEFYISGINSQEIMLIQILDINGKVVFETKRNLANDLNAFTLNIDNGVYFVNVNSPLTQKSSVSKLFIHH